MQPQIRQTHVSLHLLYFYTVGDLGATYDDHLRLIGKRVVDFLLVLIELFSLGGTAEALRAKIDRKSAFWKRVDQYASNFHTEGDVLHQSFLHG